MTSVFALHLMTMGATREEIKRINETLSELVSRAQIKQEDMSDKISLLKKLEIKFHKLVELRRVFDFFDQKTLHSKEKQIKDRISQEGMINRQNRQEMLEEQ